MDSALKERLLLQKNFFERKNGEKLLVQVEGANISLENWLVKLITEKGIDNVLNGDVLLKSLEQFLIKFKEHIKSYYDYDHDTLPTLEVYAGIGAVTAAMTGKEARFVSETSWCEHMIESWEDDCNIKFNPDNKYVQLCLRSYKFLVENWEGEYLILPFIYRSPLDAANGIRGDKIFYDMYDEPDKLKKLISQCIKWNLDYEAYVKNSIKINNEIERGVWGTYLPKSGVFVNGDPADLISGELQQEFEGPFTGELFSKTGGGFFHHHAIGMHQISQVTKTKGMWVHEIYNDPNVAPVPQQIIENKKLHDELIAASLITPVMIDVETKFIPDIAPIIKNGRFIIRVTERDFERRIEAIKYLKK